MNRVPSLFIYTTLPILWVVFVFLYGIYLDDITHFFELIKESPLKKSEIRLLSFPFAFGLISFVGAGGLAFHFLFEVILNKELNKPIFYVGSYASNIICSTIIFSYLEIQYDPIQKDLYQALGWASCNICIFVILLSVVAIRKIFTQKL